jgi:hypothetical protein
MSAYTGVWVIFFIRWHTLVRYAIVWQGHDILRRQTNNNLRKVIEESSQPDIPDELDEESDISDSDDDDDDDSDNDLVFDDFDDENDEGNEKQDSSNEKLVVSTRSGRQAGSWRLAFMD